MTVDAPPRSRSVVEVAEAMYQAGKADLKHKMPEFLDELNPGTQRRYLLLARAAIAVTGEPASADADPQLLDDLAGQLVFKLLHPHSFADDVREVLERYAARLGEEEISDELRRALAL